MTTDHDGPVTVHTSHGMIPGSHERPDGPECRCGAAWDRWSDRCATAPATADGADLQSRIEQELRAEVERLKVEASNYAHDRDEARAEVQHLTAQVAQVTRERDDRSLVLQDVIAQRDTAYRARDEARRERDLTEQERANARQAIEDLRTTIAAYRDAVQPQAHETAGDAVLRVTHERDAERALVVRIAAAVDRVSPEDGPAVAHHDIPGAVTDLHQRLDEAQRERDAERERADRADANRNAIGASLNRLWTGVEAIVARLDAAEAAAPGLAPKWSDRRIIGAELRALLDDTTPAPNTTQPLYVDADGKPTGFPRVEVTADVHIVPAGPASRPTTDAPAPGQGQDATETQEADRGYGCCGNCPIGECYAPDGDHA